MWTETAFCYKALIELIDRKQGTRLGHYNLCQYFFLNKHTHRITKLNRQFLYFGAILV